MHEYSYSSDERRKWNVWLYVLSVTLIGILNVVIAVVEGLHSGLLVIQPPTTMVLFGFIHRQFVNRLWRHNLWRKVGIVSVPDLDGTWKGEIISSFENNPGQSLEESVKKSVEVRIFQSWTQMRIVWKTDESASSSEVAAIVRHDRSSCVLHYEFHNEPDELGVDTMDRHRGTVVLNIGENKLTGRYYTDRKILTKGRIYLKRDITS